MSSDRIDEPATPSAPVDKPGRKYAVTLSYKGGAYCGWQKQKGSAAAGLTSVQATVDDAFFTITRERSSVVASGRTDAGVHALGQVAHFVLKDREWDPEILRKGLNSKLPMDIRALALVEVPMEFHAQRSAIKKQYSYWFQQGTAALPHLEPFSWFIKRELDVAAMQAALDSLVGTHDFKPFQGRGAPPMKSTVREILEARVQVEPVAFPGMASEGTFFVRVRLVGTGFLKQMVRGIAGTLLQVGERRRDPTCIADILRTLDREAVGPTAPGRALWLEKVWYPEPFGLSRD